MSFKIQGTYFKISALYFPSFQTFEKQRLGKAQILLAKNDSKSIKTNAASNAAPKPRRSKTCISTKICNTGKWSKKTSYVRFGTRDERAESRRLPYAATVMTHATAIGSTGRKRVKAEHSSHIAKPAVNAANLWRNSLLLKCTAAMPEAKYII